MYNFVSEIIPGVYVGNQYTAYDQQFFIDNNIKKVVNCTPSVPCYFPWVKYMRISVNDVSTTENNVIMAHYLKKAVEFIMNNEKPSKTNGVLIHCHAGISRSCTVATALLRSCCSKDIPHAIAMLLSKRSVAFMNGTRINFMNALYSVYEY